MGWTFRSLAIFTSLNYSQVCQTRIKRSTCIKRLPRVLLSCRGGGACVP